jgi:hypothetical protein
MRLPFSRSRGALRTVVRNRASLYDITRPDQTSTGRFGETAETTATINDVSIWIYNPREQDIDTEYGERLNGELNALSMPNADVAVHDRLTHGGETYEVTNIAHLPDNDTKVLKMFALDKVVNDGN